MEYEEFNKIVENRLNHCKQLLIPKGKEYSRNGDRLHNFKRAAKIIHASKFDALLGMWNKHLVSILDMVDDARLGILPTPKALDEKMSDNINYTLLLEALFREDIAPSDTEMVAMMEYDFNDTGA